MAKSSDVEIKVAAQTGHCSAEHKVGDSWVISGNRTPPGMCAAAFVTLFPTIRTLMWGGSFPRADKNGVVKIACPDPGNPVVFEIKRIE